MTRYSGIVVAVVGLIVTLLSAFGVIPYVFWTGIWLMLLGGFLIGLSFIPKPADEAIDAKFGEMSAVERLTKIFYAPSEVFQNLRRHPRWLVAVLIMTIFSAGYLLAFKSHIGEKKIVDFMIDQTKESWLAPTDEAKQQIEENRPATLESEKSPITKATSFISTFAQSVLFYAFLGLVCWLFVLAMGGDINYWQAFSATVYSFFPVVVIHRTLSFILLYIKDPIDIHPILGQTAIVQDNLGILLSPKSNPVLYTLLSAFSLLMFYWIFMLAIGLKNTGERVTSTTGWSAAITLYVISIILGVIFALLLPGFMS